MQRLHIVGPVAAGDLGVRADALLVFGLGVGVVAQHAYFVVAGATEVGDYEVDEVLVGREVGVVFIVFGGRVVGFGGFGLDSRW